MRDGPITGPGVILRRRGRDVLPRSAGGIHSSWRHGWAVGDAVALPLRGEGWPAEAAAARVAPRFRSRRALRWAMEHLQVEWPIDLMLQSGAMQRIAEQSYFHRQGMRV
ncbi:hypothetical protein [Stenotrophomonas bentonitica]|uniref:hypothetical protein n=1 Tax=Stenotrophomonas bentonitica TaxID=1450134 RepID=UPI0002E3524C